MSDENVTPLRRTSVALMGGLRASGRVRVEDRIVRVTTLGGMDLDLGEAEFTEPRVTNRPQLRTARRREGHSSKVISE